MGVEVLGVAVAKQGVVGTLLGDDGKKEAHTTNSYLMTV